MAERQKAKARLGSRDKETNRSDKAVEARHLKRCFRSAKLFMATNNQNQKPWLHNSLMYADKTLMTDVEKEARTYMWAMFADEPKVQVLQALHATMITEWAINDKYNDECKAREGKGNRNKSAQYRTPEPIKMVNTFENRNTDEFREQIQKALNSYVNDDLTVELWKITVAEVEEILNAAEAFNLNTRAVRLQICKLQYLKSTGQAPGSSSLGKITIGLDPYIRWDDLGLSQNSEKQLAESKGITRKSIDKEFCMRTFNQALHDFIQRYDCANEIMSEDILTLIATSSKDLFKEWANHIQYNWSEFIKTLNTPVALMIFLRKGGLTLEIEPNNIRLTQVAFCKKFTDIISLTDLLNEQRIPPQINTRGDRMNAKARHEYKLNAPIKVINEATGNFKHGKASEEDMAQCRKDVETTKLLMLTG